MKLTDVQIGKFRALWKEHYGEELSEQRARECAMELLELGRIVYRNRVLTKERRPP